MKNLKQKSNRQFIIIQKQFKEQQKEMNIKINIKDCDCEPTVITKKQISEVQFKKKNMLYAPPTKDNKSLKTSQKRNQHSHTHSHNIKQPVKNVQMEQAQRRFLNQMSQISKNQLTNNMMQNTNTILQKQNQILAQNQRAIHHMLRNPQNQSINSRQQQMKNTQLKRIFQQSADKIARQIKQIKKVRDQIIQYGQTFKKTVNQGKSNNISTGSQKIGQMNSNLKNLVQISKNHIQGLQNLQGIKGLQNFNIQAYTQAINTLKKQIVQYQKQSQNIQRELRLRSAKLQKLQISPNFDEQLLQPYQQHLKKKADSIDLHSIRQKVYEKLGIFDYGKFQNDICGITNQIKNQMNQFNIICKQFRIEIPDIKIDKKQLKMLDLKLPSVLDQFKSSKGIIFNQKVNQDEQKKNVQSKKNIAQTGLVPNNISKDKLQTKTQFKKKQKQMDYGQIYTKPVDLSKNTKLTRTDQPERKTVLQTSQEQQRKVVSKNIKKIPQKNQDDDFQKYLQNRAKQQLAAIYEQKRKKLQQMQNQLYNACKEEPQYQLTLNVKNKVSPPKKVVIKQKIQREEQNQYGQDFEQQKQISKRQSSQKKPSLNKQTEEIKNIGTQVLRQKLKNLFNKNPTLNQQIHQNRLIQQNQMQQAPLNQMASLAQGFMNMINNTLTQVNTQLSQSIQKKMQNRSISRQKGFEMQKKQPNRIAVPRLEQFRAPPVFNMQMVYEPIQRQQQKKEVKKIVPKNYDYLRIQEENNQLQISSISNED